MTKQAVISLTTEFEKLDFIPDRTPDSSSEDLKTAFAELSSYRNGAIFIAHYAGNSEWERHSEGDEIVYVLEGETRIFLLGIDGETPSQLSAGELLIVPQGVWHRFETPTGVKILTVTPQPTDHSLERPDF